MKLYQVKEEEKINFYGEKYNELLNRAKKEFELSSDAHFSLEKIYTPAMNFEKINKITESMIEEIENLMSIK